MRGYPQHLNSKQDYINMLAIDPAETVARLQLLLDQRYSWFQGEKLAEGDAGIEDETHKVIEATEREEGSEDEITVRYQYELKEDFNSHLFLIGFTVDEVENIINDNSN
ncbi:MAG: hypothetical protein RBT70_08745 [Alphaproteobacteria bacterium]|jgi:hypothetical protein|nr:hypothetical protein [Alphaproteobacteria bacterium]